jgi:hypothetical protein
MWNCLNRSRQANGWRKHQELVTKKMKPTRSKTLDKDISKLSTSEYKLKRNIFAGHLLFV